MLALCLILTIPSETDEFIFTLQKASWTPQSLFLTREVTFNSISVPSKYQTYVLSHLFLESAAYLKTLATGNTLL